MIVQTVKRIIKITGVFFGLAIVLPTLATILSVVLGIISLLTILIMLFSLFSAKKRKFLVRSASSCEKLKIYHLPLYLFVVAFVLSVPALFALSLILHWHLAAQIILGIVLSLLALAATLAIFLFCSRKKSQQKFVYSSKVKKEKENNEKCVSEIEKENNLDEEIVAFRNIQTEKKSSDNIEVKKSSESSINDNPFGGIQNVYSNLEDEDPIPDYMKKHMLNCDLN